MVKKYTITGLDCPNCAAKLEAKLNEVEGVEEAVLTFALEQLRITAEEPDKLLEELQRVADSMEEGVEIKPLVRGKKGGKKHHDHEHHHHDHDGHEHHHDHCDCGHDHDEHEHHHDHALEYNIINHNPFTTFKINDPVTILIKSD